MQDVLTPVIELKNFGSFEVLVSPRGFLSPHFKSVSLILTLSQSRVAIIQMFLVLGTSPILVIVMLVFLCKVGGEVELLLELLSQP